MMTPARLAIFGLLALAFVGVFWRWFYSQHRHCMDALQDWGHAYAVPFIAGFLVYRSWPELRATRFRPFWPGLVALTTGVASYGFFLLGYPNHMGQGFSMILALFGLVLLVLGPAAIRVLFIPIAFLAFGVTVSEAVMIQFTFKLQDVAAQGGFFLLSLLGPIFGYQCTLAGHQLEIIKDNGEVIPLGIAEACSGMRMVIAFLALAGIVAILSCRWWWQRVAVFLLALPVAIAMNIVRIGILGVASLWDKNFAAGEAHIFIGTVLLLPALLAYMACVWSLDRIWVPEEETAKPIGTPKPLPVVHGWSSAVSPAFLAGLVLLGSSAVVLPVVIAKWDVHTIKKPVYAEGGRLLRDIQPRAIADWTAGPDHRESAEIEETLGTTNYITRPYRKVVNGRNVDIVLHAAYYTGGIDTVPHVPERCMVGGGWGILSGPFRVPLTLDKARWYEDPRDPEAMKLGYRKARTGFASDSPGMGVTLPRGIENAAMQVTEFGDRDKRMYAGYFFVANGDIAVTANDVRLLAFDLKSDYAYYMKVQVSSSMVSSPEELASVASEFLNEAMPELMRCVPDWVKVTRGEYPPDNPRRGAGKNER